MLETEQCSSFGRRASMLQLAALCGLAMSGEALAALAVPGRKPGLLAPEALALTGVLAELIIPKTNTPGALAVGAHHTISHLLQACATTSAQDKFLAGLARLDAVAGKQFVKLPGVRQVALLHALDEGRAPFSGEDQQFFRQLKWYTAFAYYTSEAGATRELAYLPIPGGFKGKLSTKKFGRNWAL